MALSRDIPYLWDDTITQNGLLLGSTLKYILSDGGQSGVVNTQYINDLCIWRLSGVYAPYCYTSEINMSKDMPLTTLQASMRSNSHGNLGLMLLAGSAGGYDSTEPTFYNMGTTIITNIATGAREIREHGNDNIPAVRVVCGDFDISKFILIPYITARNEANTQTFSGDLKTYKATAAASCPCITAITYAIRYKSDLMSNSTGSGVTYQLCTTTLTESNTYYGMQSQQYNDPSTVISSRRLAPITSLYLPTEVISPRINVGDFIVNSIIGYPHGQSGTHSPQIQRLGYANTQYNLYPFVYITFDTAIHIIESIGMWYAESIADVAGAHGAYTVSAGVNAPIINAQGISTGSVSGGGVTDYTQSPIYNQWNQLNSQFPIGNGDAAGGVKIDLTTPTNLSGTTGQINITQHPFNTGDPELLPQAATVSGLGVFANYYALGQQEILAINDFLWNSDETVIDDILKSLALFGQTPINAIINLRLYPFNVSALAPTITPQEIVLGRVSTGVNGLLLPSNSNTILDLGSVYIQPKFNNFLDYAPYSSYLLYIPFIGTVTLNPNVYLGHVLTLRMVVDITTGKASALIYCEDILIDKLDGMIGVEIPVTAENMGQTVNAVIQAVGNTAVAGLTGGVESALLTAVGGAVDIAYSNVGINRTGNVGAAGSFSMPIVPFIVISSPTTVIPADFAHTYGKVCNESGTLSGFRGYTVCENVDTGGINNATDNERAEIKNLLESGVYL